MIGFSFFRRGASSDPVRITPARMNSAEHDLSLRRAAFPPARSAELVCRLRSLIGVPAALAPALALALAVAVERALRSAAPTPESERAMGSAPAAMSCPMAASSFAREAKCKGV